MKISAEKEKNSESEEFSNRFVGYLNSLQRSGGSNENALAESQACNVQFPSIHVPHPLADIIYQELSALAGRHVILTGHAGDGKSTIALEVFKRFYGIAPASSLKRPLTPREDIINDSVSIIKDLSERDKEQDQALLDELAGKKQKFLLVSNTGTLLDLIKHHPEHFDGDDVTLESRVLDAISKDSGESDLTLGSIQFRVFNLARMDNLNLAKKIFKKMLSPDHWKICKEHTCSKWCPIYINVDLIQRNQDRIIERIFLAYRRMYEYGIRLTMRQFTEHLSYMITSGLEETNIRTMQHQPFSKHLFFNRFFGDDGCKQDIHAQEMKAIQEIASQSFGERPCPRWEHHIWLRDCKITVQSGVELLNKEFEKLRRHGLRETSNGEISPDQAREQVRRMLYFLYNFKPEEQNYLKQYLNSPTLLDWTDWQKSTQLDRTKERIFKQKIYHVLQEHFTGVRLPEGASPKERWLYLTLSRRHNEVRQSAQIVLTELDWSSLTLKLVLVENASGEKRYDLVLCRKDRIQDINLPLKVSFLDYVMMRHFGEIGEVLEASYRQRLDRFKTQLYEKERAAKTDEENSIMLVHLKTDHTFRRQSFVVNNGRLEVD